MAKLSARNRTCRVEAVREYSAEQLHDSTTQPERQTARALFFTTEQAPHINWQTLGELAASLGADMEVYRVPAGVHVTIYWRSDEKGATS